MQIKSVELETVCGITSKLPVNALPEVAFTGRSNVGKSSLINSLMKRKSLARVSAKPGKTQTLNFYNINQQIYLVDLPGYGYAKISRTESEKWGVMIENYLTQSQMLRVIFLLVDMRHEATEQDRQMLEWVEYLELQPIIIATKADKVKPSQRRKQERLVRDSLGMKEGHLFVPYSSVTMEGRDEIWDYMDQVIENETKDAL